MSIIKEHEKRVNVRIREYRDRFGERLTLEQVAVLTGTNQRQVDRMLSFELIKPLEDVDEEIFDVNVIGKVRKLLRLHHDLGVSWASMGLVLDLLDRIDELENHLSKLKS